MYRISKVLNHNGVIVIDLNDQKEYVLLGKGAGFGRKVGERMEKPEDWCAGLEQILNTPAETIEDEIERDRAFHYGLICETKNTFWITIMDAVVEVYREWIDRCLRRVSEALRQELGAVHREILEGLKNGDMKRCNAAIEKHYGIIDTAMEVEA